ncbi:hypothetical protein J6590_038078 [Homalodisca vitripennis]|nr:hypothetical protein J6590_038078 [Homalodisca vitripennis]
MTTYQYARVRHCAATKDLERGEGCGLCTWLGHNTPLSDRVFRDGRHSSRLHGHQQQLQQPS